MPSVFHAPTLHANGEPHNTPFSYCRISAFYTHSTPPCLPTHTTHTHNPPPAAPASTFSHAAPSTIRRVMCLHKKMGHPPEDIMVQAVTSTWRNTQVTAEDIRRAFYRKPCLVCILAKRNRDSHNIWKSKTPTPSPNPSPDLNTPITPTIPTDKDN